MTEQSNSLSSPRALRELLARHGFALKKRLGQNFLTDPRVLDAIVEASGVTAEDGVFEVGPGAGVVTARFGGLARHVVAVEKDEALAPVLTETVGSMAAVEVVYGDVLEVDLEGLWARFEETHCRNTAVVANLPYYITTPVLFRLLDACLPWSRMVVMVQREVAERIVAPPGGKTYGVLSVAVQFRAAVRIVRSVAPSAFLPPPDVDSAVLCLERCPETAVPVADEALFFRVVRAAFATRRKTLTNALSGGLAIGKEETRRLLAAAGIDGSRRGETLTLPEFARLADALAQEPEVGRTGVIY